MSTERLQNLGRLEDKKLQAEKKKLKIKTLVETIRLKADPFEKPEDLETESIAEQALELANVQIEYLGILAEIKALKKALGKE